MPLDNEPLNEATLEFMFLEIINVLIVSASLSQVLLLVAEGSLNDTQTFCLREPWGVQSA